MRNHKNTTGIHYRFIYKIKEHHSTSCEHHGRVIEQLNKSYKDKSKDIAADIKTKRLLLSFQGTWATRGEQQEATKYLLHDENLHKPLTPKAYVQRTS